MKNNTLPVSRKTLKICQYWYIKHFQATHPDVGIVYILKLVERSLSKVLGQSSQHSSSNSQARFGMKLLCGTHPVGSSVPPPAYKLGELTSTDASFSMTAASAAQPGPKHNLFTTVLTASEDAPSLVNSFHLPLSFHPQRNAWPSVSTSVTHLQDVSLSFPTNSVVNSCKWTGRTAQND